MNEFFKQMLEAKKQGLESFQYKGKTYVKSVHPKTKMVMYKKK
jgi:hypothetical protein